jgi:hypothetical protein
LYWQAAGKEYSTGKKIVLEEFERKYKTLFLNHGGIQHHKYLAKFKQLQM